MGWDANYIQFRNSALSADPGTAALREKAYRQFQQDGLPTKKDEPWKFTSLNNFKEIDWSVVSEDETHLTHEQMQEVSKYLPSEFINFVFVNGNLNKTLSDDADNLFDIAQVAEDDFSQSNTEKGLKSLADTFLHKKINLNLNPNKVVEKPVQIVFVQSSKSSVYLSEKLKINLGENSEAKILINSLSFVNSTADAMNLSVDVECGQSSRLVFVQLQNEDLESFHFSQVKFKLQSQASLTSLVLSLGNKLIRNYYELVFGGQGAEANVYGLSVAETNQHIDNYTFINHAVGGNKSVQHYKSVLAGSAHGVFRGRVLIEPKAQKADSQQLNNSLLLTRQAQADSVPQLEIFADDVKAGHGSTVGQLNKDEIFYFLSRGINQFQAVKMLSYGFAAELLFKIENSDLRNYLVSILDRKIEKMVQNG